MEVTLALAQYPVTFHHSTKAWKKHTEQWISDACSQGSQVLVFPEYGSMELTSLFPESVREDLQLQIVHIQELLPYFLDTFREFAQKYRCVIVAPSFPVILENKTVNRCFVFSENTFSFQDKHFMTRFEDESWGISSSDGALRLFETPFGKFGVQICFDAEFPIGGHLLTEAGAQFILVPSCTETLKGATRVHIGARARPWNSKSIPEFHKQSAMHYGHRQWTSITVIPLSTPLPTVILTMKEFLQRQKHSRQAG